jgi:hypothetical protein
MDNAAVLKTDFDVSDIDHTRGGYTAKRADASKSGPPHEVTQLLNDGYDLVNWSGQYVLHTKKSELANAQHRTTETISDSKGVVVGLLLGLPPANTAEYLSACDDAHQHLLELEPQANLKTRHHRRGNYALLNAGISYGGGQKVWQAWHSSSLI